MSSTVAAARRRAEWQTARNVRFGFPQRGRYFGYMTRGVIVLPLSVGHRPLRWDR